MRQRNKPATAGPGKGENASKLKAGGASPLPVSVALCRALFACLITALTLAVPLVSQPLAQPNAAPGFHERLSEAAIERTKSIVIYNPQYFKIPYPGGDVPDHFGVCSDVIIRAYRSLGLDLQKEVHQKLGGDRNIAHRRVRVLRKLFARYGQSLTITKDPADYKPGDIVTYYIPEAIFSKDHIAIVTDKIGTSGAPMIVHNIGLGPKLDDDLFSWKITGHYRYGN